MLQKLARLNFGSSSASTSSSTVPKVVSGLWSIVKGVDDLLLEVIPARMCVDYRFSVGVGLIKVAKSENIISTPAVTRATSGFLCLAMPGVVCSAMASQTTSIRRALTS
jgi:hypothetical protein